MDDSLLDLLDNLDVQLPLFRGSLYQLWQLSIKHLSDVINLFRWTIKRVLLHGGSQEHACSVICLLSSCATSSFTRGPRSPVTGQLERKYTVIHGQVYAKLIVLDQP